MYWPRLPQDAFLHCGEEGEPGRDNTGRSDFSIAKVNHSLSLDVIWERGRYPYTAVLLSLLPTRSFSNVMQRPEKSRFPCIARYLFLLAGLLMSWLPDGLADALCAGVKAGICRWTNLGLGSIFSYLSPPFSLDNTTECHGWYFPLERKGRGQACRGLFKHLSKWMNFSVVFYNLWFYFIMALQWAVPLQIGN